MTTAASPAAAASAADAPVPADAAPAVTAPGPPGRPGVRTAAYAVVLALLAGVLMFWELGADALTGDEAQYALVVQNMREPGASWVYVSPYPPTPYFQKPPLYFWLTASTYDLILGREEFAFRAWSAAAGVGAVVLTCLLGAMLFSPEVGGLAGALLLLNRSFLLVHGARSGTFDAVVTSLVAAAAAVYWTGARRGRISWASWIIVGVLCGLASLAKPFVGVPVVLLLAVHAIIFARESSIRARLGGPLLAFVVLLIVTAPWYLAQWHKFGDDFADEMFGRNLVERVTEGVDDKHVEDWKFYPEQLTKSSPAFVLVIPAMLYTLVACVVARRRRNEHALLALTGVGWVVLFSLSASKAVHYVYPALPALAVSLAAGGAQLAGAIGGRLGGVTRPRAAVAFGIILISAGTYRFARTLHYAIPADRSPHVPWELRKILSPAIDAGDVRVIFYGFPERQTEWRSRLRLLARDCYYLGQAQRGATSTRDVTELKDLLHASMPTLVVLARDGPAEALLRDEPLRHRTDQRFRYVHRGYAVLGVDLRPVLEPAAAPGVSNRYVRIEGEPSAPEGAYRVSVTPPAIAAGRISARLRLLPTAPGSPAPDVVRFAVHVQTSDGPKRLEDATARVSPGGTVEVSAMIEQERWNGLGPHEVMLTIRPADASAAQPVRSTVEEVRLTMIPHIPAEPHPRR